jgi:hypothetical protein
MGTPLDPPPGGGQYGQGPGQNPYGPSPFGQGPYPPVAAPRAKVRPGRIWYLIPLAVFVAGVVWLVVGLLSIGSQVDSFQRVPIPAGGQISLDHSGSYVIYYEGPGASSGNIPSGNVRVVPASASAALSRITPYHGSLTYQFGSRQGRAVLTMQVTHAGRFAVEISGIKQSGSSDLAFGSSFVGGLVGTAVLSVLLIIAGLVGLLVILIIRIVKTSSARAAARTANQPPTPQPPFPQPQP